jgi:hypothetical protein
MRSSNLSSRDWKSVNSVANALQARRGLSFPFFPGRVFDNRQSRLAGFDDSELVEP